VARGSERGVVRRGAARGPRGDGDRISQHPILRNASRRQAIIYRPSGSAFNEFEQDAAEDFSSYRIPLYFSQSDVEASSCEVPISSISSHFVVACVCSNRYLPLILSLLFRLSDRS